MSLIESISGVRGIVGKSFTPEVIVRYAHAFAEFCNKGTVIVGRDGRITGKILTNILVSTLLAKGCDVRAIGVSPTPTVQLETEHSEAVGGVAVTASHNPIEWNGLKFLGFDGLFLDGKQNEVLRSFLDKKPEYAAWNKIGKHTPVPDAIDRHIEKVLELDEIDIDEIRKRRFKIALDCVNAAGGVIVPPLLERLNCKVVELNCDVSGIFAHHPEPLPKNLSDLANIVKTENTDLGIAVDPDVDRLVLIDEDGRPIGEEYTIATVVNFVLSRSGQVPTKRPVVINLSTTRAVEEIAQQYNVPVIRTPVGEINVAKEMRKVNAIIGGEGSGGVIHPKVHYGRDAIVGIVLILQQLAESGKTLSALRSNLPDYIIHKDKIEIPSASTDSFYNAIINSLEADCRVNTDDGIRLDFPEYWVHLRKSNTEPIIRIIAEAKSDSHVHQIVEKYKEHILKALT